MEVLTKILQQGTEFETLAETALADRFERLVELVTMIGDKGELPIAMALATVVPTQQMVKYVTLLAVKTCWAIQHVCTTATRAIVSSPGPNLNASVTIACFHNSVNIIFFFIPQFNMATRPIMFSYWLKFQNKNSQKPIK